MTLLFGAVLGLNRLFVAEGEEGGFDGFLLAPVDRTALFVAKAIVLFVYLVLVELFAVPAFTILLGPDPSRRCRRCSRSWCSATSGIAVIGTLIAGIAVQTRARDLIGPLITLPLPVPW